MAFGIDDALATAAAAINVTDTLVQTIKRYRKEDKEDDLELLLQEVRITALRRIDDADMALTQFERLMERRVDMKQRLSDVISKTPFWRPFEQHRLSQIQKQFNRFCDSIYSAEDDIAALVRCRGQAEEMGKAVVESSNSKHELHRKLLDSASLSEAISLLRERLKQHKAALS